MATHGHGSRYGHTTLNADTRGTPRRVGRVVRGVAHSHSPSSRPSREVRVSRITALAQTRPYKPPPTAHRINLQTHDPIRVCSPLAANIHRQRKE
eukprot:scaffold13857_cov107-Isochrysis_galbana.AAC.3